jgi:hypothetical protein
MGTNTIMEQSVYKETPGNGVKFYISDKFTATDQAGYKLK